MKRCRCCPQKLTGLAVQCVNYAGLAWNTGDDLANFATLQIWIYPLNFVWVGSHCGVYQQALKRMVQIPVIIEMLVIPTNLTGFKLQRQGAVVIKMIVLDAT